MNLWNPQSVNTAYNTASKYLHIISYTLLRTHIHTHYYILYVILYIILYILLYIFLYFLPLGSLSVASQ